MPRRTIVRWFVLAGALLVTVVAAVWPAGNRSDAPEVVAPVPRTAQPAAPGGGHEIQMPALEAPARQHALSGMQDLFDVTDWARPAAPPPAKTVRSIEPASPPPAVAPPFPYTIAGIIEDARGPMVVFTKQNQNYVVRVGEVLEQMYRVESVGPESATVTYLPLRTAQAIPLSPRY